MKQVMKYSLAMNRKNSLQFIKRFALRALALFLVLFVVGQVEGQVVVDNTSSGSAQTNVTTITVSHNTGTGNNRLMLVGVSYREGGTLTATYGGDPLDLVGSETSSNNAKTYIFSMLEPPSGTANVVITNTGGDFDQGGVVGVMTFAGVDLVTPLNTYASSVGNSGDPVLSSIPTASNQLIFDVVAYQNRELSGPGTNQTGRWYLASGDDIRGGGSTKSGSLGTTMTWARTLQNQNESWSMSAVSIRPTPIADLAISKAVSIPEPYIGQTITFSLTATNNGPDNAALVVVNDLLPAGYTYVSDTPSVGSYNVGTGVWTIGDLNVGVPETLAIQAIVNASGPYLNSAAISGAVIDNNAGNDTASQTITICNAGGTAPLFNN
jgi:uncharacterized repeat protein (TIGR01451 family)